MLIAREKKRTNLAEYILYMWQVEDLIRAYRFDINALDKAVISQFQQSDEVQKEIRDWYDNLIEMMKVDKVEEKGHMQIIKNNINDLHEFHLYLLQKKKDAKYLQLFNLAAGNIHEFRQKSNAGNEISDTEVCLTALYGILMLKLQKKEISKDTLGAVTTFSNMMAYLSAQHKAFEEEE
ncbi:MAG: DUF4924 family protein [Marinifilaceae bacterium]